MQQHSLPYYLVAVVSLVGNALRNFVALLVVLTIHGLRLKVKRQWLYSNGWCTMPCKRCSCIPVLTPVLYSLDTGVVGYVQWTKLHAGLRMHAASWALARQCRGQSHRQRRRSPRAASLAIEPEAEAAKAAAEMKRRERDGIAPSISLAAKDDVMEQSSMAGDADWA